MVGRGRRLGTSRRRGCCRFQIKICLMDTDSLLDVFLAQATLSKIHEKLNFVLCQLQSHGQKKPKVLRRQSDIMLRRLPDGKFLSREKLLVPFRRASSHRVGDPEQAFQHVLALIVTVELLHVHGLEELLAVVLGLHPQIVFCPIFHVQVHWPSA